MIKCKFLQLWANLYLDTLFYKLQLVWNTNYKDTCHASSYAVKLASELEKIDMGFKNLLEHKNFIFDYLMEKQDWGGLF